MDDLQPFASDFIQASRILKVSSPLGEDQLLPERVEIEEAVSKLFEIKLAVRAKREAVKPEELIGRLVDLSIEVQQGEEDDGGIRRPFNGLVTELHEGPPVSRGLRAYSLVLRPQMWLLSRRSDCRIWMDKTAVDIVETLFSEHGIPAPDVSGIVSRPPPQHYSVQWNETDLDYLLRRFEEDGLFFWFSHEKGSHRLHVADSAISWAKPSASAQGESRVRLAQGSSDRNHINDWGRRFSYVPGQRAGADWNFETPRMVPGNATPSLVQMPDAMKRELYEYPSRIATVAEAERAQKLRMQAAEADHDRVFGRSTSRVIEVGRRFTPYEVAHPEHAYEEHVIVSMRQTVVDRSYETNSNDPEYSNTFEAIPSRVPLTPHRQTKRPRIEGTQVALVAGPPGEEIHPDKYGRIKLWFPWDRKAKKDGSDTCWVRVAQNWAGGGWGGQIIPRIGMEVMVAFVDGDPDRPLVTGIVPNPANAVPYDLPANKTRSVFKTNTHKGHGHNELRFEDDAGREEIFIHAQKDMYTAVEDSNVRIVGSNDHTIIEANQHETVRNNKETQVGGFNIEQIGYMDIRTVTAPAAGLNFISKTMKTDSSWGEFDFVTLLNSTKLAGLAVAGGIEPFSSVSFVQGSAILNTGTDWRVTVGRNAHIDVEGDYSCSADGSTHDEADGSKIFAAGENFEVYAGKTLILACGESHIELSEDGAIRIVGKTIEIKAGRVDIN